MMRDTQALASPFALDGHDELDVHEADEGYVDEGYVDKGYVDETYADERYLDQTRADETCADEAHAEAYADDEMAFGSTVEEAADFIGALLDAAGVQKAALVGHSWGSLIAMEAAARLKDRVTHAVLVGTAGYLRAAVLFAQRGVVGLVLRHAGDVQRLPEP